jgi:glycine hydroxymethyltransferase
MFDTLNARALAAALVEEGFDVIGEHKGFTKSHQALIRTERHISGPKASKLLEEANIFTNKMELENANGLRVGTSELTRISMKEPDMKKIAEFYRRVVLDKKKTRQLGRHA